MAKVNNKTKGYNMISREVVFDTNISDRARFLYVYMACKPTEWEFYQDKVAQELGYKKDTLRKYLDELIIRGWITEEEQRNAGQFSCLAYTIEIVRCDGNLPIREKTVSEKNRNGKNHNQRNIYNISSEYNSSDKRDIEEKKVKDKSFPKKKFVKPTIEEVDAYIKEKDYHFDAEQFWNHYESVGWMIGKNHMKDWHCACATWEGRRKREIKEKEDLEPSDTRAPMDVEQWERNQRWMEENTPKYVGRISFDDFISMRGEVMLNSRIYGDILKEMHQSGYEGDIVAEFKRRNDERICSHG